MEPGSRFAELLDRLPALVGVFQGPGLEVAYANPRCREVGPEVLPRELMRRVLETGRPGSAAEIHMAGCCWDLDVVPLPGDGAVAVHAVDVSEQVAARSRAEEAERRYTALVESNVVGVTVSGEEELLEANDAWLGMLGYTREDLERGLSWTALTPPEFREADERAMVQLRTTGAAPAYEKAYLRRDGTRAEVLLSGTRISEDPLRVLATVYDLSGRRAAEREIRDLLERERSARLAAEQAHGRTRRLQDLTGSLSATLSTAEMARVAITHALEDLSASAGSLLRLHGSEVRLAHAIGYPPDALEPWQRFPLSATTPVAEAIRTHRAVVVPDAAAWERYPGVRPAGGTAAAAALPLLVRGEAIGGLALHFDESRRLVDEDVAFLLALAQQTATAMDRAELFEDRAYVARKLQEGLLPQRLAAVPGLETAVRYASISGGGEVGGDFYDLFAAGTDRYFVAVGDVCGKGTDAAVITGLARHTLRAVARMLERPADALRFLNEELRSHGSVPAFCTVLCAVMRPAEGGGYLARLAAGGHPFPMVLRADGTLEEPAVPGTMLGAAPDPVLEEAELVLAPGDAVVLYTDGVIDARRPGGQRFGDERLLAAVRAARGLDADGIASAVEAAVREHDPGPPADDRAIMVLRVSP